MRTYLKVYSLKFYKIYSKYFEFIFSNWASNMKPKPVHKLVVLINLFPPLTLTFLLDTIKYNKLNIN